MSHPKEYYLPENHQYIVHPSYTGPGCAVCGKPEDQHKPINNK